MENENALLEKAYRWFNITYGRTANEAGYHSAKIWHKPIPRRNLSIWYIPEVVFGFGEKEVDAFIKVQKILRWGMISFIWLLFLAMLTCFAFVATLNPKILVFASCVAAAAVVVCLILPFYLKPLEKIYDGKVITYIDKQ